MTLLCGQRLKGRIYMVSLLDFINSISQMDDTQDVKSSKSWWKSDVLALGKGGGGKSSDCSDTPLAMGIICRIIFTKLLLLVHGYYR